MDQIAVWDIVEGFPADDVHLFGLDGDGPLPTDLEDSNSVVVDDVACPLDQDKLDFLEMFHPLTVWQL